MGSLVNKIRKMGLDKNIDSATKAFIAILGLGLVGILFLIIFGNLSGNLGFSADAVAVLNETGAFVNITGYTLDGASDIGAAGFAITQVWANVSNASSTFLIPAANYTVSATGVLTNNTIVPSGSVIEYNDANVSYTYTRDSQSEQDTDSTIGNLTGGAVVFFSFSNVWFTLLAITLLIIIVISVIAVVRGGQKSSFSS